MQRIQKEWTKACFDFLQAELQLNPVTQLEQLINHVHLQLLQSDLSDSAIRQTGFPAGLQVQGGMRKGVIGTRASGGAILVQIVGIMEVGNSAFTLGNVRQARLDKADMTGLTRDNEEPGEGEGGEGARARQNEMEDEEEDATMPPYPRSMLSLLLSDGTTTIKAMENKRIAGLVLGETLLGFKVIQIQVTVISLLIPHQLLLKNVPVRNGIAMLEPSNFQLLGYQNDELQYQADFNFMNALRKRMGYGFL
jgi:RecQ-mediated genome instability protein 1